MGQRETPATSDVDAFLAFAGPYYDKRDPAHDGHHIERIIRRLDTFSEGVVPPPRRKLLHFLACFHGLGRRVREDTAFALEVRSLLLGRGWTEGEADEALESLERHLRAPQTVEEEIVHDSNYVELLGAFGIAKAFLTGGARGQSLEETAEIYQKQYLDRVRFRTPTGRKLAQEGREYAAHFLERLRQEW